MALTKDQVAQNRSKYRLAKTINQRDAETSPASNNMDKQISMQRDNEVGNIKPYFQQPMPDITPVANNITPTATVPQNTTGGYSDPYYKNTNIYGTPIAGGQSRNGPLPVQQPGAGTDPYYKNIAGMQTATPTNPNYNQAMSQINSSNIQPDYSNMSGYEKRAVQPYLDLENMLNQNNSEYAKVMGFVDQQTKDMLTKNKQNLQNLYQQQLDRTNNYYEGLGASTANTMANEQALAQAQAARSGAMPNQVNLTMNQLSSKQLEDITKVKGEELKNYENLYNIYKNIEDEFIKNYTGSTDKNIVNTYNTILQQKNALAQNITEARRSIQNAEMQKSMSGGGSSGGTSSNNTGSNTSPTQAQTQSNPNPLLKQFFNL